MSSPLVTIIMATYNRAHLIMESLDTIQKQTFKEWECLIIDDGSTDNTKEVLRSIIEKDDRIKLMDRPNNHLKGLPGCRNYGLSIAKGDLLIFFDDDDIVHPDNLQICVDELKNIDIQYCRYIRETFTGTFDKKFDRSRDYESSLLTIKDLESIITGKIPFNSCQVMWKKECFNHYNFNETLLYAEEWECYNRILTTGIKGHSIQKVLFYGRKHPDSNTGEFWNNNPIRKKSQIKAAKLLSGFLKTKKLLTPKLIRYFIQLGISLKDRSLINFVLKISNTGTIQKIKYKLLYEFYPFLIIGHRTKKYLNKISR